MQSTSFLTLPLAMTILATALALPQPDSDWQQYKAKHGKQYGATEDAQRYENYLKALAFVTEHNAKYALGLTTFTVEMNKFADWSPEEYARLNGYRRRADLTDVEQTRLQPAEGGNPASVDWRTQNLVTPVKDQGNCGSCWTFGTTGVLEGQLAKATGNLVSLSESNLVDCDVAKANNGCNGGFQMVAYEYVEQNGLDTESSYPYKAEDRQCAYNASNVAVRCTGSVFLQPPKNESNLETAVATIGPITIAIDASHMSFQLYQSGVYYESRCSDSFGLDHAVLAVGYGVEDGDNYWLVKNSWGTSWGEEGYIKMAKDRGNNCGVASECSYPTGVTGA